MANLAEQYLNETLDKIQRHDGFRKSLAALAVLVLLGVALHFVYEIIPRTYNLRITGGDVLSNRHFLARSLQAEALPRGVGLQVVPVHGSKEALEDLETGKLDLAFIQGGLGSDYANVQHVATVSPELLHVLVRPGISTIADLKGKRINLGSKLAGTRVIARPILEFSGLTEGEDYTESNFSPEELVAMAVKNLPEVVILTSFAPSDVADFLIKERDYTLLEMPFPKSLALRLGWVAQSRITSYMYKVSPPVPPKDIETIGVHLHLVARKDLDPRAVSKVLEVLYSPGVEQRTRIRLEEKDLTIPSGFPLSKGSEMFLQRNNPLLSTATLDRVKALFGLVLSVASTVLVVFKWFRGAPPPPPPVVTDDAAFVDMLARVHATEREFEQLPRPDAASASSDANQALRRRLTEVRDEAMQKLGTAKLTDPMLGHHLMAAIHQLRARMDAAFSERPST